MLTSHKVSFQLPKFHRASFEEAVLSQTRLDNADLQSSNFRNAKLYETNFSRSEISRANFQHADISYSRMDHTSIRAGNFYFAKAIHTNFTHAYLADCQFLWANLQYASFRYAVLPGANFENADVQNVDFTRAVLAGVNISAGQLDVVLSITNAILPDGSTGKNKNLLQNANAQCTDINSTISHWTASGSVFTNGNPSSNDCAFQARAANATLQQTVQLGRYRRLVENGEGKVYIEMQDKDYGLFLNPSVYMIVRFF